MKKHCPVTHASAVAAKGLPSFCPGCTLDLASGHLVARACCPSIPSEFNVLSSLVKHHQHSTPRVLPSDLGSHPVVMLYTPDLRIPIESICCLLCPTLRFCSHFGRLLGDFKHDSKQACHGPRMYLKLFWQGRQVCQSHREGLRYQKPSQHPLGLSSFSGFSSLPFSKHPVAERLVTYRMCHHLFGEAPLKTRGTNCGSKDQTVMETIYFPCLDHNNHQPNLLDLCDPVLHECQRRLQRPCR